MSKNVAMFVDVANMYYAARGQDVDVDYVALLKHATKGRDLIRAYAYTGLDPENENQRKFIDFLGKNGYKPVVKDIRKFGDGRMKANLDIELVVDLFRLSDRMDIAVIVSGDGDFAPAIRALQDTGVRCEVVSFKPNTSSDLIAVADEFTDIMKIASISRGKGASTTRSSMSAPEMPAKEVSPEFGFREASPSVAAAALAAIKGGGSTGGRGSRSTSSRTTSSRTATRRTATPEPETDADAAPTNGAVATEGGEEVRRRRRRRGGRGRGRSRREGDAETTTAAGAPDDEIGWEELDDLSQVDAADPDREYGFEEADAATLAELGISPEPEAEAKPKRSRSRKPAADADADTSADAADEPKPARRTPSRSTATAADAGAEAEAATEPKPRRTRAPKAEATGAADDAAPKTTRRRTKAPEPEAETSAPAAGSGDVAEAVDGEPQGIWGRFRSARKPRAT